MPLEPEEFNVWIYLIQVAPVVLVMSVAIVALWKRNAKLTEKNTSRDEANLKTLTEISKVLETVEKNGVLHTENLKSHIDDRTQQLKDALRNKQ